LVISLVKSRNHTSEGPFNWSGLFTLINGGKGGIRSQTNPRGGGKIEKDKIQKKSVRIGKEGGGSGEGR